MFIWICEFHRCLQGKTDTLRIIFMGRLQLQALGFEPQTFSTTDQLASDSYEMSGNQTLRLLSVTSLLRTRLATD
jgi:hypothetical protein